MNVIVLARFPDHGAFNLGIVIGRAQALINGPYNTPRGNVVLHVVRRLPQSPCLGQIHHPLHRIRDLVGI